MSGNLSFDDLKSGVKKGEIDTVLACIVDMQGRLMGKRLVAQFFIDSGWKETHCCNYLLATDLEMATPDGYASTSWESGYGDYVMKPDLKTIRLAPWQEGCALVLCDILDHHTHQASRPIRHVRCSRQQIAQAGSKRVLTGHMATELRIFLI